MTRPEIFISAASRDLKSCRQLVRDALLTLGCVPVVQDHFPPGAGAVRDMLRAKIAACDAVIHLAGECYGFEPQERTPGDPRRSYTQLEYDIARELKKPLYTFLCAPGFPYDTHDPEPEELRLLQEQHGAALAAGDDLYLPVKDPRELSERVHELQTRVETVSRELQKTRSWLGQGIVAAVDALRLIARLINGIREGQARTEAHTMQLQEKIGALLQEQSKLTALVVQSINPNAAAKTDPATDAREEAARQLGISAEELAKRLNAEKTDLRSLLAEVEAGSAAAESKAAEWRRLKRETLTKLGDAEQAAGHYAAEIEPYQKALALADKAQEPLLWCEAAQNLAIGFHQMGRYGEEEPLAREVLEKRTALLGEDHPDTLTTVNRLGNSLYAKGDLAGAEALYRRCFEARERTLGKEHPDTLGSLHNVANALRAKGHYAEAEALYRSVLEARERTQGKEHPGIWTPAQNLANVLYDQGDFAGAEALYRRCVEVRERTLGKEHPERLSSAGGLASVLRAKGDYAEAEALCRRVLEARERMLGEEHPDTLGSVSSLASVLRDKGDYAGAEALYRRCLEARERTRGAEHRYTLRTVNELARMLRAKGDYAEAEALDRRALEARERTLGKEHPETLSTLSGLAQDLDAEGDYASAEPLYLRALDGMQRVLPPEAPFRLDLDYHLSLMRQKQGRLAEALPFAEHAAIGAAKKMPATSLDRLKYEKNLADLRAKLPAASPSPSETPLPSAQHSQ